MEISTFQMYVVRQNKRDAAFQPYFRISLLEREIDLPQVYRVDTEHRDLGHIKHQFITP
jgi:hypothetical protein